ncbi:MAG: DNA-binding NarL/FixJ family response regulator [Alphaproteobacteria bacterium]|jgi:DNA-binding NarL/FixJ family response regulator
MEPILKVLIIDHYPILRNAVTVLLKEVYPVVDVVMANSVEDALLTPVEDLSLIICGDAPDLDMVDGLGRLRSRDPNTPILVLSDLEQQEDLPNLMRAGATAIVRKSDPVDMVSGAIRLCGGGGSFVSAHLDTDAPLRKELSQPTEGFEGPVLTKRQGQVLNAIARGLSNRSIASELGLAEGTVKIHVAAIFKSLGVSSRIQAVLAGRRLKMLTDFS